MKEATDNMNAKDAGPVSKETPATRQWESEGGSLSSREEKLPEGIQAVTVTHYRVGKYSYTNLEDAMAEHRRQLG
ncbi:hypothetical protein GCM10011371_18530 [Novosphingobium marinum]|uniref:Uncharacterized protein n=2 Tax=Novosphingobium marinum TaxID=1514948 RepID=A0A7Y9XWZ0_9SPHN|nr:hypothetical protein [Novosphingobium marinum]NYH95965.1 hypothetical protein [Novosphingobium marinum]GGC31396.1 hypothetical protein GCM10011371_18530 [Novosphingobium marinum]